VVRKPDVVKKLFETLSPRYQSRTGGYLRIVKVGYRPGDGAPVSLVELIGEGKEGAKKAKTKKKREKGKRAERTKLPEAASKP
jgi:large subunit ribosomal protein L17